MTPDVPRADLAESMVPVACDLACRVRDGDPEGIARLAESRGWDTETAALIIVLAAGWPVEDASPADLLAWTDTLDVVMAWRQMPLMMPAGGRPVTEPCGTYAAWVRHRRRGEDPDPDCVRAMRAYKREHHRKAAREDDADAA